MLTLYQYWATTVCRDIHHSIDCRLLRLRALTDLGLYGEAAGALRTLLQGNRLPQPYTCGLRPPVDSNPLWGEFNAGRPINDPGNEQVREGLRSRFKSQNHYLSLQCSVRMSCIELTGYTDDEAVHISSIFI